MSDLHPRLNSTRRIQEEHRAAKFKLRIHIIFVKIVSIYWLWGLQVKTKKNGLNLQSSSETKVANEFPIVGIGASAGGLEPIRILLTDLPTNTGLSFVIIQHLATGQESMLPEILSRFTKMSVLKVEEGLRVEPDHVYVIPPGETMTLENGLLRVYPKGKSLRPIDEFLISLASERKMHAIGIVLSGTGTDGTEGLKAIKNEGGITFAQDPESALYPDMPLSAISAECTDFVLLPIRDSKRTNSESPRIPSFFGPKTRGGASS